MPGLPITIHLTTTDAVSPLDQGVNWLQKGNANPHGSDGVFPKITQIRNTILDLPNNTELYANLNGVGKIRSNEATSNNGTPGEPETGGGVYFSKVTVPFENTAVNDKNSCDVTELARNFMTYARTAGFTQMNTIISADAEGIPLTSPNYSNNESKWIEYQDTPQEVFDSEFYKKFAHISLFSVENRNRIGFTGSDQGYIRTLTLVGSSNIKMRKDFNYKYVSIPLTQVDGIVTTAVSNGIHSVHLNSAITWASLGLSANSQVSFQEFTLSPSINETISAVGDPGISPSPISCGNRILTYTSISADGKVAFFTSSNSRPSLFTGPLNFLLSGSVRVADPQFDNSGSQYSINPNVIPAPPNLTMRFRNAVNVGSKNLLELTLASVGSTKFFGATGTSSFSMGFTAGSYVEISGFSNAANNGIFQVINVYDGVPGDNNNLVGAVGNNTPRLQYLELSREIIGETPTGTSSRIEIRNVSKLPLLHIKYTTQA